LNLVGKVVNLTASDKLVINAKEIEYKDQG